MSSISQDAWDEICVNPHQSQVEEGRQEGREAGLKAGYVDGYKIGRTKGIEFGMELGFIRGFLNTVEANLETSPDDDAERNERLRKRVDALREAIDDDFPDPGTLFANAQTKGVAHDDNNDSEDSTVPDVTDIMGAMQRMRAKFKVLTVQLKLPHFSLNQIMADAALFEEKEGTHIVATKTDLATSIDSKTMVSEW